MNKQEAELEIRRLVGVIEDIREEGGPDEVPEIARVTEVINEIKKVHPRDPIVGTAHLTLDMFQILTGAKVTTLADWKRHPYRIKTEELLYKNERFAKVRTPTIDPDLLKSIQDKGILNPLLVIRGFDGRVYVWLGNQRLAIARELNIEWVPCVVVENADDVITAVEAYKKV